MSSRDSFSVPVHGSTLDRDMLLLCVPLDDKLGLSVHNNAIDYGVLRALQNSYLCSIKQLADGWISAKFFFAFLWTKTKSR